METTSAIFERLWNDASGIEPPTFRSPGRQSIRYATGAVTVALTEKPLKFRPHDVRPTHPCTPRSHLHRLLGVSLFCLILTLSSSALFYEKICANYQFKLTLNFKLEEFNQFYKT